MTPAMSQKAQSKNEAQQSNKLQKCVIKTQRRIPKLQKISASRRSNRIRNCPTKIVAPNDPNYLDNLFDDSLIRFTPKTASQVQQAIDQRLICE